MEQDLSSDELLDEELEPLHEVLDREPPQYQNTWVSSTPKCQKETGPRDPGDLRYDRCSGRPLQQDNKGFIIMEKMGWTPREGLGPQKKGIKSPIGAASKNDRGGLGCKPRPGGSRNKPTGRGPGSLVQTKTPLTLSDLDSPLEVSCQIHPESPSDLDLLIQLMEGASDPDDKNGETRTPPSPANPGGDVVRADPVKPWVGGDTSENGRRVDDLSPKQQRQPRCRGSNRTGGAMARQDPKEKDGVPKRAMPDPDRSVAGPAGSDPQVFGPDHGHCEPQRRGTGNQEPERLPLASGAPESLALISGQPLDAEALEWPGAARRTTKERPAAPCLHGFKPRNGPPERRVSAASVRAEFHKVESQGWVQLEASSVDVYETWEPPLSPTEAPNKRLNCGRDSTTQVGTTYKPVTSGDSLVLPRPLSTNVPGEQSDQTEAKPNILQATPSRRMSAPLTASIVQAYQDVRLASQKVPWPLSPKDSQTRLGPPSLSTAVTLAALKKKPLLPAKRAPSRGLGTRGPFSNARRPVTISEVLTSTFHDEPGRSLPTIYEETLSPGRDPARDQGDPGSQKLGCRGPVSSGHLVALFEQACGPQGSKGENSTIPGEETLCKVEIGVTSSLPYPDRLQTGDLLVLTSSHSQTTEDETLREAYEAWPYAAIPARSPNNQRGDPSWGGHESEPLDWRDPPRATPAL